MQADLSLCWLHISHCWKSHVQGWSTNTRTCTHTYSSTFSVLSCTLYLAKSRSTCTRTYLSTVAKKPVLMSTLRVLLSTFLNFNQIGKKVNCFLCPPSSVSNAPHLSFFRLEKKVASSVLWEMKNINKKPACLICFSLKWPGKHLLIFLAISLYLARVYFTYQAFLA